MRAEHIENLRKTICFTMAIEKYTDVEFEITSIYRTKEQNRAVGGSPTSLHLQAKAVDMKTATTWKLAREIERLIKIGVLPEGGLGIYDNHVHYDWRGTKARWNNETN
jgi:uncharacterized protein YcbK (DUF882 family)